MSNMIKLVTMLEDKVIDEYLSLHSNPENLMTAWVKYKPSWSRCSC
jgi:hypothetical protein